MVGNSKKMKMVSISSELGRRNMVFLKLPRLTHCNHFFPLFDVMQLVEREIDHGDVRVTNDNSIAKGHFTHEPRAVTMKL